LLRLATGARQPCLLGHELHRLKTFLRLHIDRGGLLTVYPIGLDRSTTIWTYDPENVDGEAPWLAPAPGREPRPASSKSRW
jgi:hypothetical protein